MTTHFPLPSGAFGAIFVYSCMKFSVTEDFLMLDVKKPNVIEANVIETKI